jgi:hypothetical protein
LVPVNSLGTINPVADRLIIRYWLPIRCDK